MRPDYVYMDAHTQHSFMKTWTYADRREETGDKRQESKRDKRGKRDQRER